MAAAKSIPRAWSGACNGWPAISTKMGLVTVEATAYKLPDASWYDAVSNVWSSAGLSPRHRASWLASGMWLAGAAIVARCWYRVVIGLPLPRLTNTH